MTATRLRLRAAAVWRQTAVCEPDLEAVVASPDEVAAWGAGLPIETGELARAAIGDRSFVLIAAPGIGVAWVAAEALQRGDASGGALLATPTTAYGVQTRCDWRGAAAEPDDTRTVWQLAGELEGRWLAIRRVVRGVPIGPLYCVSADAVVERWSADQSEAADLAEPSGPAPAASATATEALLAFLGRGQAEAETARPVAPASGATEELLTGRLVAAESALLDRADGDLSLASGADDAKAVSHAGAPSGAADAGDARSPNPIDVPRTADAHSATSHHVVPGSGQPSSAAPGSRGAADMPRSPATSAAQLVAASPSRTGDDPHRAASAGSTSDLTRGALVDSATTAGPAKATTGPFPAAAPSSEAALSAPGAASTSPPRTGHRTQHTAHAAPRDADAMPSPVASRATPDAAPARSNATPRVHEAAPASQAADRGRPAHVPTRQIRGAPRAAEAAAPPTTAAASPDPSHDTPGASRASPSTAPAAPAAHAALPVASLSAPSTSGELRSGSAPSATPDAIAGGPAASSRTSPETREASAQPTFGAAPQHADPGASPRAIVDEPGTPASELAPRSRIAIARRHGDDLGLPAAPPMRRASAAPVAQEHRSAAPPATARPMIRDEASRPGAQAAPPIPPIAPIAQAAPPIAPLTAAALAIAPIAQTAPPSAPIAQAAPAIAPLTAAPSPSASIAQAARPIAPLSTAPPRASAAPVAVAAAPAAAAHAPGDAAPAPSNARPPAPPSPSLDAIPVATIVDTGATPLAMPGRAAGRRAIHREVRVGDIVVEIGDALPPRATTERAGALTAAIPHRAGAFDHTAASRHSLLPRRRP